MTISRVEPGPFKPLEWGWEQALCLSTVGVFEEFIKAGCGTRVWQTDHFVLIYVLEGRLQAEHWEVKDGLGYLNRLKPVVRLEEGEAIYIESGSVFRIAGISDVKYLMMGCDNVLRGLLAIKPAEEDPASPVPSSLAGKQ